MYNGRTLKRLKPIIKKESKKDWVEDYLELLSEEEYKALMNNQKFTSFKEEKSF